MKKLVVWCLGVVLFSACHNYKKDAERLTIERDSISSEAQLKDSIILDALNDFNEVQMTLDSIKELEKLVTVQSARGNELNAKQKDRMLADIALLNELIKKSKEQSAALQKKLKNANYRIGKLNATIKQLEKMVSNLEGQVKQKDSEIASLNTEIGKLNIDISTLNEKIAEIEAETQQKADTIQFQTSALNKAYYAYGSLKELKEGGVIEKSGGVLGIGRTAKLKKDFNREYFTEIDIRNFKEVTLNVKKAQIVTVHPEGSYRISGENTAETLFIEDSAEFWKVSKYLVVITN